MTKNQHQTSRDGGNLCHCVHDESCHQPPPSTDILDHFPAPNVRPGFVPSGHVHPFQVPPRPVYPLQPPAGPPPPIPINTRPGFPVGIPLNQATPILRAFNAFQAPPSLTSEQNRKKSMARMNATSKSKRKPPAAVRLREEPSSPSPVVDREFSVMFFPLNVHSPQPPARAFLTLPVSWKSLRRK